MQRHKSQKAAIISKFVFLGSDLDMTFSEDDNDPPEEQNPK